MSVNAWKNEIALTKKFVKIIKFVNKIFLWFEKEFSLFFLINLNVLLYFIIEDNLEG